MGKRSHKSDKHGSGHREEGKKRKREPPPPPSELLVAAALGDRARCKSLLRRGAEVNAADGELSTPLHAACRHGHANVAKLLLRRGGAASAQDLRGDTPAHLAARNHHLAALATLLQSDHPPSVDEPNDRGETVRQLTAAAMGAQQAQARLARERAQEMSWGGGSSGDEGRGGGGGGARGSSWEERLREELSEDDAWGAYGGSGWHADEYETPEEYAKRIWREMQARRAAQAAAAAAQAAGVQRAREDQESRRDRAREHAEQASRRILDSEQRADAEWRAAVAAGAAGAKRASYEARWEFFCARRGAAPIGFADVPWILPEPSPAGAVDSPDELQRVVLYGAVTPEERRRRLRSELIRWHPDKWEARWGRALAAGDKSRVLERVKGISQVLNALHAGVQAEAAAGCG